MSHNGSAAQPHHHDEAEASMELRSASLTNLAAVTPLTGPAVSTHHRVLQSLVEEVAADLYFLDSLAAGGDGALGEQDPYRQLLAQVQAYVASTLGAAICDRARRLADACHERARRTLAGLDLLGPAVNSTAAEEYRPS